MKKLSSIINFENPEGTYEKETREYWEKWYFHLSWNSIVFGAIPLIILNGFRYLYYNHSTIAISQFLIAAILLFVFFSKKISNELKIHLTAILLLFLGAIILIFTPLTVVGFLVLFLDIFSLTILMKKHSKLYLGINIFIYAIITILLMNDMLTEFEINTIKNIWLVSVLIVLFTTLLVVKSLGDILNGISDKSKELRVEKNLLSNLISSIDEIVVTVNENLEILQANSLFETFFNGDVIGKNISEVIYIRKESNEKLFPLTKISLNEFIIHENEELLFLEINNNKMFVDLRVSRLMDIKIEVGYVLVFRDISINVEKEKEILYLNDHDGLTGLYNRRFMEKHLKKFELEAFIPMACIVCDVNGLKMTNDVFGHYKGDELLRLVSNELKLLSPSGSIVGRWGGDEFVILVPNTNDTIINEYIHNIRESCPEFSFIKDMQIKELLSIGYDIKNDSKHTVEYHFQIAENKMYHAKLHDSKVAHNLIIEKMSATLRDFEIETKEHIQRVKEMSLLIVEHLALDDSEVTKLKEFINYHDVGKVATAYDLVKFKESNKEITLDKKIKHSEIGYQIAKSSSELINISYLILTHHERWDGSGYPLGLSGRGIPYLSRIFRVAHDFDTLLNGAFSFEPHTMKEVVDFITENSGKIYDPDFAKILIEKIIPEKYSSFL